MTVCVQRSWYIWFLFGFWYRYPYAHLVMADNPAKTGCEKRKLDTRIFVSSVGTDGGLRGTCHAGERDKHPHRSNRTVASDLKSPSLYHAAPPSARLFRFYKQESRILLSEPSLSEEEASSHRRRSRVISAGSGRPWRWRRVS